MILTNRTFLLSFAHYALIAFKTTANVTAVVRQLFFVCHANYAEQIDLCFLGITSTVFTCWEVLVPIKIKVFLLMFMSFPKDFEKFVKKTKQNSAEIDAWFLIECVPSVVESLFDSWHRLEISDIQELNVKFIYNLSHFLVFHKRRFLREPKLKLLRDSTRDVFTDDHDNLVFAVRLDRLIS